MSVGEDDGLDSFCGRISFAHACSCSGVGEGPRRGPGGKKKKKLKLAFWYRTSSKPADEEAEDFGQAHR